MLLQKQMIQSVKENCEQDFNVASCCLDYLGGNGPERMTNENVNFAFNNFVNAWLMGINVLRRGELHAL